MNKIWSISLLMGLLALSLNNPVKADELTVNIDVKSGESITKVLGADIYALVDDQLVEITVSPDKLPFKWNFKAGALRIKSFWATNNQIQGITKKEEPVVE